MDEGNPLNSLVVGFGSGAAYVQTQVQVYQAPDGRKIMEFTTLSDSGKLPGAAPTLGAGAVLQGGVTAGMAVANATAAGVKTYRSDVARMAADRRRSNGTLLIGVFCPTGLDQAGPGAQGKRVYDAEHTKCWRAMLTVFAG